MFEKANLACMVVMAITNVTVSSPGSCPPWSYSYNGTKCRCDPHLWSMISCFNDGSIEIPVCYCITPSDEMQKPVMGICLYLCHHTRYKTPQNTRYYNISGYDVTCDPFHRTGQMCGSCVEGYAPPVYSYSLACVECSDYKYNWLKYIAVAFLPLTLFYFLVIFFRLNIISPPLNGFVALCQVLTIPPVMQLFNHIEVTIHHMKIPDNILTAMLKYTIMSMYGIWNLDFFRAAYKPFCLHPNMTTLQAISLDYIVAVYPLCLIVITYILVELHDHYRVVVWLWTPFRRCFIYFRREWDISNSLIGAFATFLLLSYVKILYVSFSLLMPNTLYTLNETAVRPVYLFYDGTIEWFGRHHICYAILALAMFIMFNVIPLVLMCTYPRSCTRRCLSKLCSNRFQQALNIFMDIFQGDYKFKPHDCRYFAGVYLALRLAVLLLFCLIPQTAMNIPSSTVVFLATSILITIFKPYQRNAFNILDAIIFLVLAHGILVYFYINSSKQIEYHWISTKFLLGLITIEFLLPTVCSTGFFVYRMIPKAALKKLKTFMLKCRKRENEDSEPLPSQLGQCQETTPLVHSNVQ